MIRNKWFGGSIAAVLGLAICSTAWADTPVTGPNRVSSSTKGSFLAYSKIELRWDSGGNLTQDTILELTNDFPDDVCVQLYLVNGDAPLDPVVDDLGTVLVEGEPGWNWVDCSFCLTRDQPTYWSAATGLPAGCQPFDILDPAGSDGIPGRPDPDVAGGKILRGFVYAWAVDNTGCQIRWNHLSGGATLVNYANTTAWEYNAWAFQVGDSIAHDTRAGECGRIVMDGSVYDSAYDMLLMDFFQPGSQALSSGTNIVSVDTDLTLHPVVADLRQDSFGPVTTKAKFDIWNEDERSFSGTTRCITCWDQTLLSQYGNPNNFINLQADKGKARIDGIRSDVCDVNCIRDGSLDGLDIDDVLDILGIEHVCSYDAALLGVVAKVLAFNGDLAMAGRNLVGMGQQGAFVKYDIIEPPGEFVNQDSLDVRSTRNGVKSPMGERGQLRDGVQQAEPVAPPTE